MAPYVGHGTIAGRLTDARDNFLDDAEVTLSRGGYNVHTTTTYVFRQEGSRVNSDPVWGENFAFADVPTGRWTVSALLNGERVSVVVDVYEGVTSFVELKPNAPLLVEGADTSGGDTPPALLPTPAATP
jgi:hypothetical protein